MKKLVLLLAVLAMSMGAHAQNVAVAAPTFTFNVTAAPISLPGNRTTVAGLEAGLGVVITPNVQFISDNLAAPGNNFSLYGFGEVQHFPKLSTWINNKSANLSGTQLDFYLKTVIGVDRVADSSGRTYNHFAVMAGPGFNYKVAGSNTFTLGVEVKYLKAPGFANNTLVIEAGPAIHF